MDSSKISRRDFNRAAGLAAAGLALSAGPGVRSVLGANERLGIGLIGAGGMGMGNLRDFLRTSQVDCIAVADPYTPHAEEAVELTMGKAKTYTDFRRVLDHKDIDAVIIATPDHWHAIPMIAACQAGKDVYQEKPLSHTLFEGRKMVEAAAKYHRVVQVGTQQRSGEHFQKAVDLVRSGKIGKVHLVETWINGNELPEGIGKTPNSDPPPYFDWDMWLGPAPKVPYNRNHCHYNFRFFWNYSCGKLTDWGTHLMDVVHWAMEAEAPKTIYAAGGKYIMDDDRETPDTIEVTYEYPESPYSGKEFIARFSTRSANAHGPDGHSGGVQFYGTLGTLFVDRAGYTLWPESSMVGLERVESENVVKALGSPQHYPHVLNFLECVKSRKKTNSDVETMHRSTSAGLLAAIAYKTKRKLIWDAQQEQFPGDAEANGYLTKEYRSPWKVA